MAAKPDSKHVKELILQALETELGGVEVYRAALECAENEDLRREWQEYQTQTKEHVQIVQQLCDDLDIDASEETPGRLIVRSIGEALVEAMKTASQEDPKSAELVACECVVLAETKDHLNWELIGELIKEASTDTSKALKNAHSKVEEQEDEHLYHTQGWCRELWIQFLGMKAVLPPPEETKDVKTAIGAARAKQARAKSA